MSEVKDIVFSFAGCKHTVNAYDLSSNRGVPLDMQYKTMYLIHQDVPFPGCDAWAHPHLHHRQTAKR